MLDKITEEVKSNSDKKFAEWFKPFINYQNSSDEIILGVRVPVLRSHSISIQLVTEDKLSISQIKDAVSNGKGVKLYDDAVNEIYPMPLIASDQDLVYVGRIREDLINENGIALWCCGDQIRKGAATNAVQIAELL